MDRRDSPVCLGEDRLSKLHDPLIHRILSCIGIKNAVQTCILSKRWMHLWRRLPIIKLDINEFSSETECGCDAFVKFVGKVLMLRQCDIERFHLNWNDNHEHDSGIKNHINAWIRMALEFNLQELVIHISVKGHHTFELHPCVFTCKSLKTMDLNLGSREESMISLPDVIDLPKLERLELNSLSVSDRKLFSELDSSCPVIETLIIKNCTLNVSNISSLSLKLFVLKDYILLLGDSRISCLKLYAPNLKSFSCSGYMWHNYVLENLSSLETAYVDIKDYSGILRSVSHVTPLMNELAHAYHSVLIKESCAHFIMNLLRGLQNVMDLVLEPMVLVVLSATPRLVQNCGLRMNNLKRLGMKTSFSRGCLFAVTYLLKTAPNVETLFVQMHTDSVDRPMYRHNLLGSDVMNHLEEVASSPFMLHHLKVVTIVGVEGRNNELKFFEILFKKASVLNEVVIMINWECPETTRRVIRNFRQKLLTFQIASSRLIEFTFM